ncbi:MAG: ATP-dependent helicase HrpB [Neomegalonema sp.]|nr:ATP-dependent helicase HrpB [Neomegalonema sp.]
MASILDRLSADAPPIFDALPEVTAQLAAGRNLVLEAPPGAGKTTYAPLALLDAPWLGAGRIVMLEPRRIAARTAAERMAELLGEKPGATVGYRMRDAVKTSAATRIEVITEGVLTRRLQRDPELSDASLGPIACVIFDEIHERSLQSDLGLALCLEAQAALRPDLRLMAMSATLDGERIAELMDAARVRSEGRAYPVETRWRDAPLRPQERPEEIAADTAAHALTQSEGDVLVFLPGVAEIRRAAARLAGQVAANIEIRPLYGDLTLIEQQAAIAPAPNGKRKIALATAIAETSLTIQGVRVVVDAGRSRRARFDPGSGMDRLATGRVSRAAAEQRRGRAGRLAPGICYRLWPESAHGALPAFDPPEIMEADLAGLALELAAWGAAPQDLPFLDQPPATAFAAARDLLQTLGALNPTGGLTKHGERLAAAPLHPRLAHMTLRAGADLTACRLAALIEERDPLRSLGEVDIAARLRALDAPQRHGAAKAGLERVRNAGDRLRKRLKPIAEPPKEEYAPGALLALAFPDRIAARRPGGRDDEPSRYALSGGRGAVLRRGDPLGRAPFLVAADLFFPEETARAARDPEIRLAATIERCEIESLFDGQIVHEQLCEWSRRDRRIRPIQRSRLGAATLETQPWPDPPSEAIAAAAAEGVRHLGVSALPWTKAARRLQKRAAWARKANSDLLDLSDAALLERLDDWLTPHLGAVRAQVDLEKIDLLSLLDAQLDWPARQALDAAAPAHFTAPTGSKAPIDYDENRPKVSIRLQELFGLTEHPHAAGMPILFELLSPAHRPIQMTADLPGFWSGSYSDVAKEMRARYPKHPWPDDPANAEATRRAKPRK